MSDQTTYTADVPPPAPAGVRSLGYALNVTDGQVYAVEWVDDWIPVRAVGPVARENLDADPAALDWAAATDVRTWNAANLVDLCETERRRMRDGVGRGLRIKERSPARPLAPRSILSRPSFDTVNGEAGHALNLGTTTKGGS